MKQTIINNAFVVNEGKIVKANLLLNNGIIQKISEDKISADANEIIDAEGLFILPGCIDDQVHFREPGLTHKGDIYTESRAAVAGGITSYMEMPNTIPNATTQILLEEKYTIAKNNSVANYSFFMGATNDNLNEVLKTDGKKVCGIKIFMGSSTGNMLVDDKQILESIFKNCKLLIATHCEDEQTIRNNTNHYRNLYGNNVTIDMHPKIRSEEACYLSSSFAVGLAKSYDTRLHILHISTEKEISLFSNDLPLKEKRITAEACIHHLWFSEDDYKNKGNFIKWNPAIKTKRDKEAILKAVLNNTIDVIATDHAPHTIDEKSQSYLDSPSGGPLVQHGLLAMLELHKQKKISLVKIAEKMSHNVAECFQISNRGFIREGYAADLVLVDLNKPQTVAKSNILYKCGWSPFEGVTFSASVCNTFVNGNHVYNNGKIDETVKGQRLIFNRN
jgi:dihydroorotase